MSEEKEHLIVQLEKDTREALGLIDVPKAVADKVKQEELDLIRKRSKRLESKRARRRMGDPVPVVCKVCSRGQVTLYKAGDVMLCGGCRV